MNDPARDPRDHAARLGAIPILDAFGGAILRDIDELFGDLGVDLNPDAQGARADQGDGLRRRRTIGEAVSPG